MESFLEKLQDARILPHVGELFNRVDVGLFANVRGDYVFVEAVGLNWIVVKSETGILKFYSFDTTEDFSEEYAAWLKDSECE